MKNLFEDRASERGSAGIKFLLAFLALGLLFNAGYNYVPVAYDGASFRQEMDTAVVKGLAASGRIKPIEAVEAHLKKAASDYNVPSDAVVEVGAGNDNVIQAHVEYQKTVSMLPFGLYKYVYKFNYTAVPQGYLLKE